MGLFDKLFVKKEQKLELKEHLQSSKNLISAEKFWEIIAISKTNSSGEYEKQQVELEKELLKLPTIEILEFANKFRTLKRRSL